MCGKRRETAAYCIEAILTAGLEKAQCRLRNTTKDEFNVESGEMTLLRTTSDTNLSMKGIIDSKKGTTTINKVDRESIDRAVAGLLDTAVSSEPDEANDIAENQPHGVFSNGPLEPDLDLMYDRTMEFLEYTERTYPSIILEQVILQFVTRKTTFMNSNGVQFESSQGYYAFSPMFTAKEGKDVSSFNYSGFEALSLDRPLHEYGSIDTLLKQSSEQLTPKEIPGKFTGRIIITPDCVGDFISYIASYLSDYSLITGTSIFKDALNSEVADQRFTLRSMPVSEEIADGYFFTGDGYASENSTVIEKGVLRTFLLSLYGARKTGLTRGVNTGGAWMVDPGDTSYDDLIGSVDRGILLSRFSGGNPSDSGDFSGVAKNSYYIENGQLSYPIRETMISGNLESLLKSISGISRERIDYGTGKLPWILVDGVTISGK